MPEACPRHDASRTSTKGCGPWNRIPWSVNKHRGGRVRGRSPSWVKAAGRGAEPRLSSLK